MVISHKYRFIFIKTRKTAGTSLEVFLSRICTPNDVLTPINPPVQTHKARNYTGLWNPLAELLFYRGHTPYSTIKQWFNRERFYNHIPTRLLRYRIPSKIWNNYFKFCIAIFCKTLYK